MLEDLSSADPVDLSIDLAHKGDGYIRHKVKHVHSRPTAFTIKVCWIRPLVSRRALKDYGTIREELSLVLIIPIVDGFYVVLLTVCHSPVFVKAFTENLTDSLGELKHSGDDARSRQEDVPVLELKASPALTNHHEVGKNLPNLSAHLDEEGVSIGLHGIGVPVSAVLIPDDDFSVEKVSRCISWLVVRIFSQELLGINLHDLRPGLTIV